MLLVVHVTLISLTLLVVLFSDEVALEWLLGARDTISKQLANRLHLSVSAGLAGTIVSGSLLAWPRLDYLMQEPVFLIKMLFVVTLVVNAVLMRRLATRATQSRFADMPPQMRRGFYVIGGLSMICWMGAIVCGILLGY